MVGEGEEEEISLYEVDETLKGHTDDIPKTTCLDLTP